MSLRVGDNEIEAHTAAQLLKRQEENFRDVNHALAGLHVGRNTHKYLRDNQGGANAHEGRFKRSAFDILMTNPAYAAAYENAIQSYGRASTAIVDALNTLERQLQDAREKLKQFQDKAHILPDGTRVYLDANGDAITEAGRKLTDEEQEDIRWKKDAPNYSDYASTKHEVDDAADRKQKVITIQGKADDLHGELTDKDNPPSADRVRQIDDIFSDLEEQVLEAQTQKLGSDNNNDTFEVSQNIAPPLNF